MNIKSKIAAAISLHMFAWLAMFIVLVGVIFLTAGVYWLLEPHFGQGVAAIIVGGGLLGIMLVTSLVMLLANRAGSRARQAAHHSTDNRIEHQLRPIIGERATDWAKANSGIAIVGALSAGVLIAASPNMRRLVVEAARPLIARKALQVMQDLSGSGH